MMIRCSPWELEISRIAEATSEMEQIPRASYGADEQAILDVYLQTDY